MQPLTSAHETLLDISAAAGSAHSGSDDAAAEVLDQLHDLVPYVGSSISAYDPLTGGHRTLASTGYDARVVEHLDTWFVEQDAAYQHLRRVDRTPLRWRDFPFDYEGMYSAQEVFIPAGYRDGMTICTYTRDGRYSGNLHISTDDTGVLTSGLLAPLSRLSDILGGLADQMRTIGYLVAAMDGPGGHAAVVLADARVLPVPGRPTGEHLYSGSLLARSLALQLAFPDAPASSRWRDDDGRWHRIRTRVVQAGVVVTGHRASLPHGLTPAELRVLTKLAQGMSNTEVAAAFCLSSRTVGKHVEHILEKLACSSRTAAAARAITEGLVLLEEAPPTTASGSGSTADTSVVGPAAD